MGRVLEILDLVLGLWLISGTALSLTKHPHWYIRGWDFPRVVIACLALVCGLPYGIYFFAARWYDFAFLGALAAVFAWQLSRIWPYTRAHRQTVKQTSTPREGARVRIAISNVLLENHDHERWLRVIRAADPDVIHAVEIDRKWDAALRALEKDYPHSLSQPQDNYYGMVLYSRFPIHSAKVHHVVQDDVPSIRATIELPCGDTFTLIGLHPPPPEPLRNQDSAPRDAELVVVGKTIRDEKEKRPIVVTGDLNDVAWSYTTQLFLRLSGLLDPRMGRGLFSSYNANNPLFRFPIDHVFHTNDWKLVELRRLDHVGSDHFPMLIELSLEPEAENEQPEPAPNPADGRNAREMVAGEEARERDEGAA